MILDSEKIESELKKLDLEWAVVGGNTLTRVYKTKNFSDGVGFVVRVGELADKTDHHPDVRLAYSEVEISLTTHSESGLTQKDFDLAQQIDKI